MAIKQYVTFRPVLSINIPNTGDAGADNKYINPETEKYWEHRDRDQEKWIQGLKDDACKEIC